MTLGAYADVFLARCRQRLKPRTVATYAAILRDHLLPTLGAATPLRSLERRHVRLMLQGKLDAGYMGGTVKLMQRTLSALLTMAMDDDELLDANVARGLSKLCPQRKGPCAQRAFTREQTQRFLAAAKRLHLGLYVLFVVGARTGLRLGELLGLQWGDVDLPARTVLVQRGLDWQQHAETPKGRRAAVLPLSQDAVAALRALDAARDHRADWIFHGPSGRPWSRTHVRRVMARACAVAGLRHASPHALRHSFVTQLDAAGVPAFRIRDLARHHSVVETEKYLHRTRHLHADVNGLDGERG